MGQVLLDLDSAVQMLYGVWPIISILLLQVGAPAGGTADFRAGPPVDG